jgi:hypothetical protein
MELLERIKRDVRFNSDEVKAIGVCAIILGFVFAFGDWSIFNFITAVLIVLVSIAFHVFLQKIVGVHLGAKVEFKLWWYGLLASVILVFISNGKLWWLIIPGGFTASIFAKYRVGKFRFGLNYRVLGIIGLTGPIASIIFASIFQNINLYTPIYLGLFQKIFIWNLVYAIWSVLPIPPLDGHNTFFAGRLTYVFTAGIIIIYSLLILIGGVYSWIWALIGGFIIYLLYLFLFERTAW